MRYETVIDRYSGRVLEYGTADKSRFRERPDLYEIVAGVEIPEGIGIGCMGWDGERIIGLETPEPELEAIEGFRAPSAQDRAEAFTVGEITQQVIKELADRGLIVSR